LTNPFLLVGLRHFGKIRLGILDNTVWRRSSAGANSPLYLMTAPVLVEEGLTSRSQPPLSSRSVFPVQACGGLTSSNGEGSAPGMSGDNDALPALDDRTRHLIASLIETSVQSALAAPAAPSLGDGSGPARARPPHRVRDHPRIPLPRRSAREL
jgi:hypothetical protein